MPADFDDWRQMGNVGWGWEDVRPYFERSERRVDAAGQAHGEGPLDVKDVTPFLHPMRRNWLEAAAELGLGETDDFNGPHPEGFGCYQVTIRDGLRRSAADAFLRPALRRGNVRLQTDAWASKIRFDQRRAVGVDYVRGGISQFAAANREVILCAGAVNSPQLLQLSGIGPAATLSAAGIAPLLDNPAVGGNLQDHLAVVYSFKATQPTLNDELHSTAGKLMAGLRYLLTRRGPLSLSVNQFGGFARADPQGAARMRRLQFPTPSPMARAMQPGHGSKWTHFPDFICASSRPGRPASAASISQALIFAARRRLRRTTCPPKRTPRMWCTAAGCYRRLHARGRSASLILEPIAPDLGAMGPEELIADFRARASTVYHPAGTCRMGASAGGSVVDASLRVHGMERLRVVDASVFPTVTSANTNAPHPHGGAKSRRFDFVGLNPRMGKRS